MPNPTQGYVDVKGLDTIDTRCITGYLREIKATSGSPFALVALTMSEDPFWSRAWSMFLLVSCCANVSPLPTVLQQVFASRQSRVHHEAETFAQTTDSASS